MMRATVSVHVECEAPDCAQAVDLHVALARVDRGDLTLDALVVDAVDVRSQIGSLGWMHGRDGLVCQVCAEKRMHR